MLGTYQISLLDGAIGIRVLITEEARAFLARHYNSSISYARFLHDDFGIDPASLLPFGGHKFGYHGMLDLNTDNDATISASYEQCGSTNHLSASFYLLFKCLNGMDPDASSWVEPIEVELEFRHGTGGYELRTVNSSPFHRWLNNRYGCIDRTPIPNIRQAMLAAGRALRQGGSTNWEGFLRAEIVGLGGLDFHCDENCCCMGGHSHPGESFRMSTHNSDWPVSQLTFLAGVAAISGEYLQSLGS